MFSPDNFYDVIYNRYGYPKTNNLIMVPKYHGAKNLLDLVIFKKHDPPLINLQINNLKSWQMGRIVLYDQEPFFPDVVNSFRNEIADLQKTDYAKYVAQSIKPSSWFTAFHMLSTGIGIWCHSELNSPDIENLKKFLFVDCYYWYHGMIARDWFRHWQWIEDLVIGDRSLAPNRFLLYARGKDGTREYRKTLIEYLSPLKNHILYDWDSNKSITSDHSAMIDVSDSVFSSIQIVAETLFETNKIHLTEKIFKPMVMSQPFILLAAPGSLQYLRNYGFKTFNQFWDESYDLETNHQHRLQMIINLIKNLANMPKEDFIKLYQKILPIIDHNRKWFYSQKFQELLINEMFKNFDVALQEQKELLLRHPGGQWAFCLNQWLKEFDSKNLKTAVSDTGKIILKTHPESVVKSIIHHYPKIKQWYEQTYQ